MVPSVRRAHSVNTVAPTRTASPRKRTQCACTVRGCQSAGDTILKITHTMTAPMTKADPNGTRLRASGPRDVF